MKELSIEEKARAYDEAIKRGLDYIRQTPATEMVTRQDIFEAIFPQFKESEDEKIRKWLVEELYKSVNSSVNKGFDIDMGGKALSWLEKQSNLVNYYEDKLDRCACEYFNKGYKKALENQGEHNIKFMEEQPANQKRKSDIVKAAVSATGIIEQEEWFIKGAEWSDKNPSCISYENQGKQKEYTFNSIPRLLEMIEPSSRAKAYCQKLINTLIEEGYPADAKIVIECLKQMNGEEVPMATMDEKQKD